MQSLAPTSTADNPNQHTPAEVRAALVGRSGGRRLTFHYRLLDHAGRYLRDLDNVLSCTIEQDWLADIKRSATFRIRDTGVINYLSDRIQPWARLCLPPYGDKDWVQWPQGVFLLSSAARDAGDSGQVERDVDAYDRLQVYVDDAVTTRYTVAKNTTYTSAVNSLLGLAQPAVIGTGPRLPAARDWEPGTPKLQIINELLSAINYNSLSFDERGQPVVRPYLAPDQRPEEYVYADDQDSVMLPEVTQTMDLFSIPNKWTMVVSDPDRVALTSTYTNISPGSPTSTVRRGRTIVDFTTGVDAADQAALDALVRRKAFESSQVYEAIDFTTAVMPIHSGNDVYRLTYGPLAVGAKYTEQSWSMPLKAGATMRHKARRVVTV